jgi:hypothetical protein
MLVVYERAVAERDDFSKQARSANMRLSQQRLVMAHAQRQLDRARRENLKLRSDIKDLSKGHNIEVLLRLTCRIPDTNVVLLCHSCGVCMHAHYMQRHACDACCGQESCSVTDVVPTDVW